MATNTIETVQSTVQSSERFGLYFEALTKLCNQVDDVQHNMPLGYGHVSFKGVTLREWHNPQVGRHVHARAALTINIYAEAHEPSSENLPVKAKNC